MAEPPPNTLCHTVYADRTIGLIITAWPSPVLFSGGWLVCFRRNAPRLNQCAAWLTSGRWDDNRWHPVGARLVPPAALTAVEAWLVARAAVGVAS